MGQQNILFVYVCLNFPCYLRMHQLHFDFLKIGVRWAIHEGMFTFPQYWFSSFFCYPSEYHLRRKTDPSDRRGFLKRIIGGVALSITQAKFHQKASYVIKQIALPHSTYVFSTMWLQKKWRYLSARYCCEFVNIVCKICKYYLFLYNNISDVLKIFIFCEKLHNFS